MQIDYTSQSVSHVDEPASYWQETATHPTLADDLPPMVEVAIIGGGILGTAISYWLARAGIATLVLERTRLAYEASGRNGGFVSIGPAESYPSAIARLGHETAHAAQRNGSRFCAAKVLRLTQRGEGMIVHTTSGSLQARLVIVAVNAWIGELLPALAPVITPIRGQVLAFAPIPSIFTTGMSTETTPIGAYGTSEAMGPLC